MKYEKPIVLNLSARAQFARGQNPQGCVAGTWAGNLGESCGSGGSATWGCTAGGSADFVTSCMSGGDAAGSGDCLSGSVVTYYCETGASGDGDPYGCNVGPSNL